MCSLKLEAETIYGGESQPHPLNVLISQIRARSLAVQVHCVFSLTCPLPVTFPATVNRCVHRIRHDELCQCAAVCAAVVFQPCSMVFHQGRKACERPNAAVDHRRSMLNRGPPKMTFTAPAKLGDPRTHGMRTIRSLPPCPH